MKTNIKYNFLVLFLMLFVVTSCTEDTYSFGDIIAPTNVVINTVVVGKDATHPDGDGSGKVNFTISGDHILGSKIDYDINDAADWVILPNTNSVSYTYNKDINKKGTVTTYTVTLFASGIGGSSTIITKDVTVRFD